MPPKKAKTFYEALEQLERRMQAQHITFTPLSAGKLQITCDELSETIDTNEQFEMLSPAIFETLAENNELINRYKQLFESTGLLQTANPSAIPLIDNIPLYL